MWILDNGVHSVRKRGRARSRSFNTPIFKDLAIKGNCICNSSVILKAEIIKAVGGFSEDRSLIAAEDYCAWLEIAQLGKKFKRIRKSLGYYWVGDDNISSLQVQLDNLNSLNAKYSDLSRYQEGLDNLAFFQYAKGKTNFRLDRMEDAMVCFRLVCFHGYFLSTRLKACIYYCICWFRTNLQSN